MKDSSCDLQRVLGFIAAFSNQDPMKLDYYQFAPFFEELNIAEVRWLQRVHGKVVEDAAVYESGAAKALEPIVRSFVCNEVLQRSIILYKNEGSAPWTENEQNMVDCYCELCFTYGSNYMLRTNITASENVDRDTGIPTMPVFRKQYAKLCARGMLDQFVALYINIKNCKLINKHHGGYQIGTQLLRGFAQSLSNLAVPEQKEIVIRLGGDNFLALVRKENLDKFLKHLREVRISVDFQDRLITNTFTTRAGIFVLEDPCTPFDLMMNNIGRALSLTRVRPYHDFVYFDAAIERVIMRQGELESEMESALTYNEFLVLYQPKVSISDKKLVGAEALVRWKHGDEMISPGEFIPLFEQNGFVLKLDFHVLELVCQQLRKWIDSGADPVPVSVNFSRVHFDEDKLAERILAVVNQYNIPPKYIEIEFTESMSTNEMEKLAKVVTELKEMGITVSMDDFGAGYSSLGLLQDLKFDVIKIDRSLCDVSNERKSVVLEHVIGMARALNLCVVCEGVEFIDTYQFIEKAGCDMIQGFLFDRPLSLDVFEERLKNKSYTL